MNFTGRVGLLGLGTTLWYFWATMAMILERRGDGRARAWRGQSIAAG